jgi:lipopolysaccharide export system protein LptA
MLVMRLTLPRFTIERLRTLVLIGGGLLVAAIAIFLAAGQWKLGRSLRDIPGRLGIDIQQQANGVDYTQTRKGKTLFKIHAARAVQMKSSGKTLLHDVHIDLYGEDGTRADTISGSEFEYDPAAGVAHAAGAVEITLMRPGAKPAIAQLKPGGVKPGLPAKPSNAAIGAITGKTGVITDKAGAITDNEIHVQTSGLVFNQKSGVATTDQRVDFALRQGSGNSIGAIYNSAKGELILDRAVELHVDRGTAQNRSDPVTVHATHAEFHRNEELCQLTQAVAEYSAGTAKAADALIHFREDGSVIRMDGSGGVDIRTQKGGHVTAPRGTLEFDEHNHPHTGLLDGGTQLEMIEPDRHVEGSSPAARLFFDGEGQIRETHLEQGVVFHSQQQIKTARGTPGEVLRSWKSQTADIDFAAAPASASTAHRSHQASSSAQGRVEARTIHGFGGVVLTSETRADGQTAPARLSADTIIAELAPGEVLSTLSGSGHASFEQRTAKGVRQASSSDQLDVRMASGPAAGAAGAGSQIAAMHQAGHVVLVQDPAPARSPSGSDQAQPEMRATADRADYDGQSEILHLWGSPRVRNGALDMTANQIDFARASGDAFAHGDVKASWSGSGTQSGSLPGAGLLGGSSNAVGAGAGSNGPVHAVAADAELHQATQEIVFRAAPAASRTQAANQPRLWQAANSVSAPLITLNRQKQTLTALAGGAANPVRTVLIGNPPANSGAGHAASGQAVSGRPVSGKPRSEAPSVIRVRSGDLHYSEGERLALFHGGAVGSVTAETTETGGDATVVSQEAEVKLMPAGVHANTPRGASNTTVDQITARGRVTVDWPDRKGTGEKLVYLSEDGSFTLTGTGTAPPRMTDPAQGTVTGSALIYHSRDDSITVEGDGAKTATQTRSKK